MKKFANNNKARAFLAVGLGSGIAIGAANGKIVIGIALGLAFGILLAAIASRKNGQDTPE